MNEEIKEKDIIQKSIECLTNAKLNDTTYEIARDIVLDYITNLQEKNERLKTQLNCKEYFSATMPEDTEFVILTKNNYDRQQKDIQLELLDYKSRCEKGIAICDEMLKVLYDYTDRKVFEDIKDALTGVDKE